MTTFTDLPIEIKLEISKLSLTTFNSIIRTDKSFYSYINNHSKILSLIKDHFTIQIEDGGETRYELNGKQHREGDLPAHIYIHSNGSRTEIWYKEGELHRDGDLPAIIHIDSDGSRTESWYKAGKRHHDGDFPAHIYIGLYGSRTEHWYKDGK